LQKFLEDKKKMEALTLDRPRSKQQQIILNVASRKYNFFMELLRNFDFVKVVADNDGDSREEIIDSLKQASIDWKLIKEGKLKTRPLKDFLNEV
jgi:hypothetical protein